MPGKRFTSAQKLALYEQFKKSSLSKSAFEKQCGVSSSAFARWVNEINSGQHIQQQAFDQLLKPIVTSNEVQPAKPTCEITNINHIEFIMPNSVIIKLPISKDLHLLAVCPHAGQLLWVHSYGP